MISSNGVCSKQTDIVIYDADHCPVLRDGENHQYFPHESVYAAIQVKSRLSTSALADAVDNIASVKRLATYQTVPHKQNLGGVVVQGPGATYPAPYGVIFAYALADNVTLDGVIKKLKALNCVLPPEEWVNAVCILDVAHLVYSFRAASQFHVLDSRTIRKLRREGHEASIAAHTNASDALLDFYLGLVGTLNGMTLSPPKLERYLDLPQSDGVNYFHLYPRPGMLLECRTCERTKPALIEHPWPAKLHQFFSADRVSQQSRRLIDMSNIHDPTGEAVRVILGDSLYLYREDDDERSVEDFRLSLMDFTRGETDFMMAVFNGKVVVIPLNYLDAAPLIAPCRYCLSCASDA